MRRIIHYVIFIILILIPISCSSSSLTIVKLNLPPQQDVSIEVRPFPEADKLLASRGFEWRGAITDILNKESGLYTSFDEQDYTNLRKSLIESLRESQSFQEIYDVHDENESVSGVRLYLSFDESGVNQTSLVSFCFLNAFAWTEASQDSVISKKEIKTKGKSNWSVNGAKNAAITKFIKEIAYLLSTEAKEEGGL
jgi:hypothetical protein